MGSWSKPFADPAGAGTPATVAAVLPDGRVLYGDGTARGSRILTIGRSGASSESATGGIDGDVVQLADGRQLAVGDGSRGARIFSSSGAAGAGTSQPAGSLISGRSYGSAVTLADGKVAVLGGSTSALGPATLSARSSEVFNPSSGTWREIASGPTDGKPLPPNARVYLAPDGSLFYTGDGQMFTPFGQSPDEALWINQGTLNPATGAWTDKGVTTPRSSPASVALPMQAPYDKLTILRAGGTLLTSPGSYAAVPTTDLTTIDRNGAVTNRAGPELHNSRWFSQAIPLPTGEVLLTSGARNDEVLTSGAGLPVREAEIYSPKTNMFYSLASSDRARTYRNTAVLLPNGQVLVGGHAPQGPGVPAGQALPGMVAGTSGDPSFELFNPPYLYRGERPHIDSVQSGLGWGENVSVITDDAPQISQVLLMRLPSTQHVMDNDTRTLDLDFTQTGARSLSIEVPADGKAAPPGYYYLVINRAADDTGLFIPSVARVVKVGARSDRDPAPEPMGEDTVVLPAAPAKAPAAKQAPADGPAPLPVDPPIAAVSDPQGDGALPSGTLPAAPVGSAGRRTRNGAWPGTTRR